MNFQKELFIPPEITLHTNYYVCSSSCLLACQPASQPARAIPSIILRQSLITLHTIHWVSYVMLVGPAYCTAVAPSKKAAFTHKSGAKTMLNGGEVMMEKRPCDIFKLAGSTIVPAGSALL